MLANTTTAALQGRGGLWPFAGHFFGALEANAGGSRVTWAGRITSGADLDMAWRAARAVHSALRRVGPIDADRRRALSIVWARLDGVPRELLGPNGGDGLVLIATAQDPDGVAVTGIGLSAVYASSEGLLEPWVTEDHPLLGLPGLPQNRPGALTLDGAPEWLVAVAHGEDARPGPAVSAGLTAAGVHR